MPDRREAGGGINEGESWRRKHEEGDMKEKECKRKHGGGMKEKE